MPTLTYKDVEDRIRAIVQKSSKFKIGETSQTKEARLSQHSTFSKIEVVATSKYKKRIDECEGAMLKIFKDHPKCSNEKEGSAGKMTTTDTYLLYVVYNPK